jgi:hypothetical protein
MRIRLHDIPTEVDAYAADLRVCFDVVDESGDYVDRGASTKVRRYVDIRRREPDPQNLAIATTLADIADERRRQLTKWGIQHRSDGRIEPIMHRLAANARSNCDYLAEHGGADWRAVLLEEVYEAVAEDDPAALRAELVQVAAVAAAWIEDIDARDQ